MGCFLFNKTYVLAKNLSRTNQLQSDTALLSFEMCIRLYFRAEHNISSHSEASIECESMMMRIHPDCFIPAPVDNVTYRIPGTQRV